MARSRHRGSGEDHRTEWLAAAAKLAGKWFAGLVAFVVGGALVAWLGPMLIDRFSPPVKNATVDEVCLETGVPRGEWLTRSGATTQAAQEAPKLLARAGALASADTMISGYKHGEVTVRGSLLDATSGAEEPETDRLIQQRVINPKAAEHHQTPIVWFPLPTRSGRFLFRIEIVDFSRAGQPGLRLAQRDGPVFRIGADHQVRMVAPCAGKVGTATT